MSESLQQLVLDTLNSSGNIPDTRDLIISGKSTPAASHDAQITILGALNSLLSREVRPIAHYSNYLQSNATTFFRW
jgi:phenylalanyl-tRNA synthetase alpha chain